MGKHLQEAGLPVTRSINPFNDNSLIAKYEFEGNYLDSRGVYNGTVTAPATINANGRFGSCVSFEAGGRVTAPVNVIDQDTPFTVSLFVFNGVAKATTQGFWGIGAQGSRSAWNDYNFLRAGTIGIDLWGSQTYEAPANTLSSGWDHVTYTYDASNKTANWIQSFKLYVNGNLQTLTQTRTSSDTPAIVKQKLQINGYVNDSSTDGRTAMRIDQFEIYNRALSQGEIRMLRDQRFPSNIEINNIKSYGGINILNCPTSSAGLVSGDVWRDGDTLKIVP
jgi:hypothetical protein